mmetsp:Transcript_23524/g.56094  ORF Transcript_23524/g.56094 Transcript_23524/m.56094 type:complete len:231 (-) Transcript_23524:880-1572(-)
MLHCISALSALPQSRATPSPRGCAAHATQAVRRLQAAVVGRRGGAEGSGLWPRRRATQVTASQPATKVVPTSGDASQRRREWVSMRSSSSASRSRTHSGISPHTSIPALFTCFIVLENHCGSFGFLSSDARRCVNLLTMRRQSTDSRRDALNLSRSVFLLASPKYSSECRRCSVTRASDPSGAIKFSLRTGCDQLPSRESGAGKPGSGLGSFFEVPGTGLSSMSGLPSLS